jgi:hypothetical protein
MKREIEIEINNEPKGEIGKPLESKLSLVHFLKIEIPINIYIYISVYWI